jgi:hypothetical protein
LISDLQLNVDMSVMPANDYIITGEGAEREKFLILAQKIEQNMDALRKVETMDEHRALHRSIKAGFDLLKEKAVEIFTIVEPIGSKEGAAFMVEIDIMASFIITDHLAGNYK